MMTRLVLTCAQVGLLTAMLSSCIAPGPSAKSAETNGSASAGEKALSDDGVPILPAVKPKGALLSDGSSTTVMNIEPPGSWFIFNDHTKGTMTPPSTGEFASAIVNGAIHSTGKGFSDWGGGIGFNFVGAESLRAVNATAYKGITVKAYGAGSMHVALATKATMPEFNTCSKCYDHFATDVSLTSSPKVYSFTWAQLTHGGWGVPQAPFDATTIIGLNFTSKGAAPWDFSIDDLAFIP
jgi:hypothetical protein